MKKLILNISDSDFEKFRFEAIHERKSIPDLIRERLFTKEFDKEVLEAFDCWMNQELEYCLKD